MGHDPISIPFYFDMVPTPLCRIEIATSRIVDANAALCALLGYTKAELLNHTTVSVTHPDDRYEVADKLSESEVKTFRSAYSVEKRLVRKDGSTVWVRVDAQKIEDDPCFLIGALTNITVERAAINSLNESLVLVRQREEQLELAASAGAAGVWDWNLVTNDVRMTPLQKRMLGIPEDQVSVNFTDFRGAVHPEDVEMVAERVRLAVEEGADYSAEFRIIKNGQIHWLTGRGRVLRSATGAPLRMVGINCDVTDFKREAREREELHIREKTALNSSAMKSQFLANMSHELRTPINGVLGMTQFLLETHLTPEQREYSETILSCAQTVLALVNDVLDLSKIESGKLELDLVPFSLESLVDDLSRSFDFAARAKGIELKKQKPSEKLPDLYGDAGRLKQVLSNLLSNAIKFTDDGFVSLKYDVISKSEQAATIRFEIQDTGIGIADDTIAKLFTPFSQADASTTRRYGGTGLGLSICKELSEAMNGRVGVESKFGHGSLFWVELTLKKAGTRERANSSLVQIASPNSDSFSKLRILVVEDNLVNQKIALKQLERLGVKARAVDDGAQAVELLRVEGFDVVLMDCQMPIMDGFQATKAIRALKSRAAETPIIAVTANAFSSDRDQCLAIGMNDYIAKPFKPDELKSKIEALTLSKVA